MTANVTSNIDYQFTLDSLIKVLEDVAAWHKIDEGHGERTAILSLKIAAQLENKLSIDQTKLLNYAARIHDLGRIAIDDSIMLKNGPLTTAERGAVETHPRIGYNFLYRSNLPLEVKHTILYHHEYFDGSGYPEGLKSISIPLFARIVTIADTWDALTSQRPYRKPMDPTAALNTMNLNKSRFDPELYAFFLRLLEDGELK